MFIKVVRFSLAVLAVVAAVAIIEVANIDDCGTYNQFRCQVR
jgi:hypothetical protein